MALTACEAHERLDRMGLLDAAFGPGVYALELEIPTYPRETWDTHFDVDPPAGFVDRLRAAERFVYAGASQQVYSRIMDHVNGRVRQTAIMRVAPPIDVVGVWPCDFPEAHERNRALALSGGGTVAWVDGELL